MTHSPLKIAVLLSGSGRTLQNLLDEKAAGRLDVSIERVISSRADVLGVQRALDAGIPTEIINPRQCGEIFDLIDRANVDLVCLAGWMCFLEIPARYTGRVMNIHPALLPAFGGKGMYGARVHQAVLDYGCKITGCTVHFVTNEYDAGPIILQRTCPVHEDDDAHTLADRVFAEEKRAYPDALRLFAAGRLKIEGRRVRISPR
jgi:phosphoribosylglycinamide formyltransferase-1